MSAGRNAQTYPLTWNFSPLFSGDSDPKIQLAAQAVQQANADFAANWSSRSDYLTDPAVLRQALDDYDLLHRNFGSGGNPDYYLGLRLSLDQGDTTLKAQVNKMEEQVVHNINTTQFFTLNLAKIPLEVQVKFLSDPGLQLYHHFLERTFAESRHLLTEPEEKILTAKSLPAHVEWTRMTSTFLSQAKYRGRTYSQLGSLLVSPSAKTRALAAAGLNKITAANLPVAVQELNAILGNKKIDDELRGFPRPDSSRHLTDDISTKVVDSVLAAVSSRFDLAHRFYRLRASLQGLPQIKYYDRLAPYGQVKGHFSYSASVDLVHQVFSRLDPDFARIFMSFVTQGQFDVYPQVGKRGGAFCAIELPTQPTYILLNHADRFEDVRTIAHESGHGINNELMKSQNSLNFGTPLSTAEVASTFMEDFVFQELLSRVRNNQERLSLLIMKLDDDIGTIFRQVACYRFEQELHEQFRASGFLSAAQIGQLFTKHMSAYMGPAVEQSPGSTNWWVGWSHIRNFFYVYSYASGLLISKSLQNSVKSDPGFISQVKSFLSAGSSASPQDLFARMGIDITDSKFWDMGIMETDMLLQDAEHTWKEVNS